MSLSSAATNINNISIGAPNQPGVTYITTSGVVSTGFTTISGGTIIINDGTNDRILIGYQLNGF